MGAWTKAVTGTSSPLTYTFASGDGSYEFYTVAVDVAGNRETPPAAADAATRRDAVDDPPDFSLSLAAAGPSCTQPVCPLAATGPVSLSGSGLAVDDRSTVSVSWQLWGVKSNGQRQKQFSFKSATPTDGAFNSRIEGFSLSDSRSDTGYVYYDVDLTISAGSATTTRTVRVFIDRCRALC